MAVVANIGKGAVAAHAAVVQGGSGSIVAIPLLTAGLVADDALQDYDTVADLLAGASSENTTMGRKTLASVTVTVDDTANTRSVDAADLSWTSGQMGGGAVSALCLAYSPAGATTDADLVPLVYLDCAVTPDGNAFAYIFDAAGWYTAGNPA